MRELLKDKFIYIFVFVLGIFIFAYYVWASVPPRNFPSKSVIVVEEGAGLYELAEKLQEDSIIRSPGWFRAISIIMGGERTMKAGEYYLPYPQNVFTLSWRILHGEYSIDTIKITIPEGFTVDKITKLFDERFINFDENEFKNLAEEGYLFPDTYFISPSATASSVIKILNNNFYRQTAVLLNEKTLIGRNLEDVVIMASIVERETNTREDREIVSGILWQRLRLGLPLQVDAAFTYINGKSSAELTQTDLNSDTPYNTYKYKGLPPTPISNPGLQSIKAVLNPIDTDYLFFLTGDDGKMHYSVDFDEHKLKKQQYIGG